MSLKKNIIANYIGNIWAALMSFVFVPFYIKYLGMESYGVISLFAVLQVSLSIILAAINPVLNREMSRYTGNDRTLESIGNLLRTLEIVAFCSGLLFVAIFYLFSDFIAEKWLIAENLPIYIVSEALTLGSIVVVLKFIESLYGGAIIGLQKQVALNSIVIIGYTLKNAGVILALKYISPTLKCFCYWQIFTSLFMLLAECIYTYKLLPGIATKSRFSLAELKGVGTFAFGSVANAFVSLITSQSDKVILSKFLNLSDFGHYSLAASVTNVLYMSSIPITQALYPQIVKLKSLNNDSEAALRFHQGCQLISILCSTAVFTLIFFGENLLGFWTQNEEISQKVFPMVQFLAIGIYCQIIMSFPTLLSYIEGKPMVSAKINIVSLVLIFVLSLPMIINYGLKGALWSNVIQNAAVLPLIPLLFNCYLKDQQKNWFLYDAFIPIVGIFLFFYLGKNILSSLDSSLRSILSIGLFSGSISVIGLFLGKDLSKWLYNNILKKAIK